MSKKETDQERLSRITKEQADMQEEFARKRKLRGIYEAAASSVRQNEQRKFGEEKKKAGEYFHKMEESRKQPQSNQNLHVGSIGTWMMDCSTRFENIVKFMVHRGKVARKQYIGVPLRSATAGYATWAANYVYEKAFGEYDINHPEFRYSVNIDDNGAVYAEWFEEHLGDYFKDENGDMMQDEVGEFNALLQEVIHEWVNSLDGADPECRDGYFTVKVGANPNPVSTVIYPKSVGRCENGEWVLDEVKLRECYGDAGIETVYTYPTPKPGAEPQPGHDHLHITQDKFLEMLDGFGNQERSIEGFMSSIFPDTPLEYEPPSTKFSP